MDEEELLRIIAYHDEVVCHPYCHDDISTYPKPPDNWVPSKDYDEQS